MKRDMDLVRDLLLKLEEIHAEPFKTRFIPHGDELIAIEGRSADDISYHLQLVAEAGLIAVQRSGFTAEGTLMFKGLTWKGHEFLDSVRDPEVWRKTKSGALEAGGWTLDLLKDLGKGYLKKQIEERTGISL